METNKSPFYQRQYISNAADNSPHTDGRFSLVTYNILADCNVWPDNYPWLTAHKKSMAFRHAPLLVELWYLDADVVCLQEVDPDYFQDTLLPAMKEFGYAGVYVKRVGAACREGEATLYKTSAFTLLSHRGVSLRDQAYKELADSHYSDEVRAAIRQYLDKSSVALLVQLRCKRTGAELRVANTHLSFDRLQYPDVQCVEVSSVIRALISMADGSNSAHIICGDFNSWMGTPVYQLTKAGHLNDSSIAALRNVKKVALPDGTHGSLVDLWRAGFGHSCSALKSAYDTVMGYEPTSTRYPHDGSLQAVDIIWYSSDLISVSDVLGAGSDTDLISPGIPNQLVPSDHLPMAAKFAFKL